MIQPPFVTLAAELRALQDREIQYASQIQLMATMRAKTAHVDKLRILRCQCSNYISKITEICDGIER